MKRFKFRDYKPTRLEQFVANVAQTVISHFNRKDNEAERKALTEWHKRNPWFGAA